MENQITAATTHTIPDPNRAIQSIIENATLKARSATNKNPVYYGSEEVSHDIKFSKNYFDIKNSWMKLKYEILKGMRNLKDCDCEAFLTWFIYKKHYPTRAAQKDAITVWFVNVNYPLNESTDISVSS